MAAARGRAGRGGQGHADVDCGGLFEIMGSFGELWVFMGELWGTMENYGDYGCLWGLWGLMGCCC